jgi:hypothetical protein
MKDAKLRPNLVLYTAISVALVSAGSVFLTYWCPWTIELPNSLVYFAYALFPVAVFIDPHPKDKVWIYWITISISFLRVALLVLPDMLSIWGSEMHFVVRCVEPVLVVVISLTCCTVASWRRFTKLA